MSLLRRVSERRIVLLGGGAVAGIGVLAIVLWQLGLFESAPPPATLESAVESLRGQQEAQQSTEQTQTQTQDSAAPQASEQQKRAETQQSAGASTADDGYGGSSTSDDPQAAGDAQPSADTAMAYEEPQQAETEQPEPPAEPEQQAQPAEPQQTAQQSDAGQPDSTGTGAGPLADLAGTWTLSEQGESFVGYRIGEELAQIGTTTAVGRTSEIVANLQFDGSAITSVEITADLRTLQSDQSFRDGALRSRGLESDTFPWGIFTLTEPIAIDALPSGDAPLSVTVAGTLEVHGVSNDVEIALEGRYVDGFVVVVGSTDFVLADYEIEKPTGFRVLSIEDAGIMEFQLVLERTE